MRATRHRRHGRCLHDSGALVARKTGSYSGRWRLVVAGDADGALLRPVFAWPLVFRRTKLRPQRHRRTSCPGGLAQAGQGCAAVARRSHGRRSRAMRQTPRARRPRPKPALSLRTPRCGGPVRSQRFSSSPQQTAVPSEASAFPPSPSGADALKCFGLNQKAPGSRLRVEDGSWKMRQAFLGSRSVRSPRFASEAKIAGFPTARGRRQRGQEGPALPADALDSQGSRTLPRP